MNDKDLMKKLSTMTNEEIEKEAKELMNDGIPKELIKPLWEDEMLKDRFALEEMMYMHRDSIACKMMESIRKDCEEE